CETYLKDYDVLKEGRYFIAHKNEWAFLNVPINQVRNTDVAVKSSKQGLELILSKENPSEEGKISKKYKIGKEELFEFGQKVFTFSVKDISESRYEQRIFSNNDYYPPVRVSSGEDLERYLSVAVYSDNLLVYSGDLKIEKEIGFSLMSAADSVEENDQTNHHLAGAMQGLAKKMEEKGVFYVPKRDSISLKEVRENSSSSIYSGPISSRERDTGFEEIDKSYLPVIKKEMSHLVDTFNEVVR
ncbi:MAG: hypothetical protein WCK90_04895, partial [archaeon]